MYIYLAIKGMSLFLAKIMANSYAFSAKSTCNEHTVGGHICPTVLFKITQQFNLQKWLNI